jgi:hypothetical protein
MRRHVYTLVALSGAVIAGTLAVPSATADPSDDPCALAISFFCRFVPIAPELDGDVDLTKDLPPAAVPTAPAESQVPVDTCAAGCG